MKAFLGTVLENSPRSFALFLTAIHTGMRLSELAGLQWGDVDFRGKFLTVRRQVVYGRIQRTKTDKIRRIDMSDSLMEALRRHRKARREEWLKKGVNQIPRWVFSNKEGNPPDMHNVKNRHFYPNLAKAGLRRIRFHDLRHTFASLLVQDNQPLAYVKEQLAARGANRFSDFRPSGPVAEATGALTGTFESGRSESSQTGPSDASTATK